MFRSLLFAGVLVSLPVSASAAELITNGGFEDPSISNPCCNTVPPDALPGWTVNVGNVNVVNGTFASAGPNLAFEALQYLDLVGQGGFGSISQLISTVQGQAYNLTFAYSHNLFAGLPSASASFSVDGLNGTVTHSTGSNANLDWKTYSGSFVASGSSATLNFTNLTGAGNEGIFLDAVSINAVEVNPNSAVPEPSSWALMLVGFAALGGALRASSRKRKVSLAFG